jgi:hypothetical protein
VFSSVHRRIHNSCVFSFKVSRLAFYVLPAFRACFTPSLRLSPAIKRSAVVVFRRSTRLSFALKYQKCIKTETGEGKRSLNYLRVNKSHNRGPRRKSIFISLNALKARYFYDRAVYGKRQLEAKLKFDKLFSLNIRLAPRRCSLDSFFSHVQMEIIQPFSESPRSHSPCFMHAKQPEMPSPSERKSWRSHKAQAASFSPFN